MLRRSLLLCAFLVVPFATFASSSAGTASGASSAGSSASSDSSSDDDKVVLDAREDAAGFVASNGELRGARLQAALLMLRERDASLANASDMALARSILAQ